MKSIDELVLTLHSGVAIIGILVLVLLYRNFRVDWLRDELFALRDELFDFAVSADLINEPSYRQLRNTMNAMIRYSHKISLVRLILVVVLERLIIPPERRINPIYEWEVSLSKLFPDHRKELLVFHRRMGALVMRFIAGGIIANPVHLLLLMAVFIYTGCRSVHQGYSALLRTPPGMRLIEAQALQTLVPDGRIPKRLSFRF
jgi:hypothetical protein